MKKTPKINNQESKRPKRRFKLGRFLIICFSLVILGSSIWKLWVLHIEVNRQLADLNLDKQKLVQRQKELQNEIVKLNTPSYIEQLAREQLGLVRHGEIMIAPKK